MIFEIFVSIISFIHKLLLLKHDKKAAWIWGIIAALLSIVYFYTVGLFVFAGLELGMTVLISYGLFTVKTKKIDDIINICTAIICIWIAYIAFSGSLTLIECLASLGSLFGVYFLTHDKDRAGWWIWIATYLLIIYTTLQKQQIVYSLYQMFALIVAIWGLRGAYCPKRGGK